MSKELSLSLLEIEKHLKDFVFHLEMGKVDEMFISNSFEIIEKALKALEIIKNKQVDVRYLFQCKSLRQYNFIYEGTNQSELCLTEEEYDILKEVLL